VTFATSLRRDDADSQITDSAVNRNAYTSRKMEPVIRAQVGKAPSCRPRSNSTSTLEDLRWLQQVIRRSTPLRATYSGGLDSIMLDA
jgi:hypothetical protein